LAVFGAKILPKFLIPYISVNLVGSITVMGIIFSYLVPIFMTAILKIADLKTHNQGVRKIQKVFILSALSLFLILDLFLIFVFHNYVLWIGFFVGLVTFLIFILTKIVRPNVRWVWLPMIIFMAAIVTFKLADVFPMNKVNLPVEVHLNYQASKSIAIESVKDKAIVGSGPATYGYDFSMHRPKAFNLEDFYNLRFFQGTGLLAEMLSTVGILGVFFLLIVILSFIGSQIYLLVKDKENNKLYSLGLFSASVVLLANNLFIRADGVVLNLTVIITALSLATLLFESKNEKNNWNFSLKSSPKFALALAFVFITVSTGVVFIFIYLGQIYVADMYAAKASKIASGDLEKAIGYLEKTIKLNNRESKYYVQIGQYYMGLANKEALREKDARDINKIQKYLNNSVLATAKAKDMSKNNVEMVESLALIYENAGLYIPESLTLAEENYKRAQELEPHNAIYNLKLGQIKISMAQSEQDADKKKQKVLEAKDLFQKAIEEKNNYAENYYQLALTNEALSELDPAIENIKKAVQFNPKEIDYLLFLGRIYQLRNKNDDLKIAESYYKKAVSMNDKNVNTHFYLGLLYEKMEKKAEAKDEYNKVISLLKNVKESESNKDTITKLQKMIENVDKGIKNTPENLGLTQAKEEQQKTPEVVPAPIISPIVNAVENPTTNPEVPTITNQPETSPEIVTTPTPSPGVTPKVTP
ncbi:MAG: hypothetical protein WA019_01015, partial [Candidatus Moraniibacteriota bacterium]